MQFSKELKFLSLGDFMQKIKNLKAIPSEADLVIDNLAVFN